VKPDLKKLIIFKTIYGTTTFLYELNLIFLCSLDSQDGGHFMILDLKGTCIKKLSLKMYKDE
jgi:hypothetical protein